MLKLSKRLQGVANLVTAGSYIADIGTDHAYVPIFLSLNNRISGAIAMDIREGPLRIAEGNVCSYGLEEKVQLRLSDGFTALVPGEVEIAVLAGMGGALMIKILREHWDVTTSLRECVLQPQSELFKVREFLLSEGFIIVKEDIVKEEDKYYPMMKVIPPKADSIVKDSPANQTNDSKKEWSKAELAYGKLLLEGKHLILKEFLAKELQIKTTILEHLREQTGTQSKKRVETLQCEIELVREGMMYYEV